ncbi:MAG: RNA polymerase sigma factor [Alphaproteobacteria bacterium]|nr:RNA polymerase sigma factor [Alphaproteobacteria bacterium]
MRSDAGEDRLALGAAAGDRSALAALLDAYYEPIHRMAWRWCRSADLAEDVAQDVCVKIAGAIRNFKGDAAFSTWVWRITYNATLDHMRRSRRLLPMPDTDLMALIDSAPCETQLSPESNAIDGDLWREVHALPPQQRDAVLLIYAEDMSHAEAALVMGCTEKTVSWHLHTARKTLRNRLEAAE